MAEQRKRSCAVLHSVHCRAFWGMLRKECAGRCPALVFVLFHDIIISKNVFGGKANGIRAKTGVTDCQKGGKSRQGVFFKGDTHLSCPISHVRPVLELARRLAVFLLETLGKILRVVEAYGIGYFGHGHVGLP